MAYDEVPEYSTRITKEIECPFCKARIPILFKPSMLRFHVSRVSAKTARVPYRTEEKNEILVEKCTNCGRSKKEIERALKHGKELSNNDVLRRLRDAGLDPSKLK